ncbi:hypothetical protein [Trichothermofontia sp.]
MKLKSINHNRDVWALRRFMLGAQIASIGLILFGVVAIRLFVDPTFLGTYRGTSEWIWLWAACSFILSGVFFGITATRWPLRLMWIFQNTQPQTMQLTLKIDRGTDSTDYVAILDHHWYVVVYSPAWNVQQLQEISIPAQVYFDPTTDRPAVIETRQGVLWAMAGRSSYTS